MALFGLFGKKDDAAEIKKLQARATAKFGPPENRQGALQKLVELKTPDAFAALLQRFTVRVEPGITDDEEKGYVYESLVDAGEAAVGPIKAFLQKCEQPSWALRALEKLVPADDVIETILVTLEKDGPEYTRDPEKKITLLRHLEAARDPKIAPRLVPFFEDPSEDVRFAAIATVAAQADESSKDALVQVLVKANEERSERLRRAAADALVKTGFSVKGASPSVEAALPQGYVLDKSGVVKTR